MKGQISFEESSFRDPSGAVFYKNNKVFRQINKTYKKEFDLFVSSGLKKHLEKKGLLIKSKLLDDNVLEVQKIPFISYPYEWSFSQLKDAALLTLEIQKEALKFEMSLKDASSYNIQFYKGKPIFIDILSFEKYEEGTPWIAYRQFCQHFLAPLSLMVHKDIRLNQLFKVYLDGIPLDLTSKLLPKRTWFDSSFLTHIHIHSKTQSSFADKAESVKKFKGKLSKIALLHIIESLKNKIKKLNWHIKGTQWGDYYTFTNYSNTAFENKKKIVERFLKTISPKPKIVWDLGANTGEFSKIAYSQGAYTVAFDIDPLAVEKNYINQRKYNEENLLPLLLDITNPSTGIGWSGIERKSLISRGPADCILALALIHHLAITNNVPLSHIAKFMAQITSNLIIEFVPKNDSNTKKLLILRKDIFPDYSKEKFDEAFSKYFKIIKQEAVKDSKRTMYLMKKI